MKVRSVLLDVDFVNAIANTNSLQHERATATYRILIDRYGTGIDRLFALSTTLSDLPKEIRRSTFAPVAALYVARQHRAAARKVSGDASPQVALTLVMLVSEKIRTVATLGEELRCFDLDIISDDHITPFGQQAQASLSSETAPQHAPLSRAE